MIGAACAVLALHEGVPLSDIDMSVSFFEFPILSVHARALALPPINVHALHPQSISFPTRCVRCSRDMCCCSSCGACLHVSDSGIHRMAGTRLKKNTNEKFTVTPPPPPPERPSPLVLTLQNFGPDISHPPLPLLSFSKRLLFTRTVRARPTRCCMRPTRLQR